MKRFDDDKQFPGPGIAKVKESVFHALPMFRVSPCAAIGSPMTRKFFRAAIVPIAAAILTRRRAAAYRHAVCLGQDYRQ